MDTSALRVALKEAKVASVADAVLQEAWRILLAADACQLRRDEAAKVSHS